MLRINGTAMRRDFDSWWIRKWHDHASTAAKYRRSTMALVVVVAIIFLIIGSLLHLLGFGLITGGLLFLAGMLAAFFLQQYKFPLKFKLEERYQKVHNGSR